MNCVLNVCFLTQVEYNGAIGNANGAAAPYFTHYELISLSAVSPHRLVFFTVGVKRIKS